MNHSQKLLHNILLISALTSVHTGKAEMNTQLHNFAIISLTCHAHIIYVHKQYSIVISIREYSTQLKHDNDVAILSVRPSVRLSVCRLSHVSKRFNPLESRGNWYTGR